MVKEILDPKTGEIIGQSIEDITNSTPADETTTVGTTEVATVAAPVPSIALAKRHPFFLDCTGAITDDQKECKDFGYYCDGNGRTRAQYGLYAPCEVYCGCRLLKAITGASTLVLYAAAACRALP